MQFKWSLQALALEANDQLKSFPDFVVVTDELLLEFDNWYQVAIGNFPESFSDDQKTVLNQINLFIDKLPREDLTITIKEELETSKFWQELRILAREALLKFNWTSEIPPLERVIYIKG